MRYNFKLDMEAYREQLVKKVFILLPLRDEGKEWEVYLEGLLVELAGMEDIIADASFASLAAKLQGLFSIKDNPKLFRKVVLDSVPLVKKLQFGGE